MNRGPHMNFRVGEAESLDAKGMANIYAGAFDSDTPKLMRVLYRGIDPVTMIEETLRAQLHRSCRDTFLRAVFDDSHGNFYGSSSMSKSILIRSRQICLEDIYNPLRRFTPQISPGRRHADLDISKSTDGYPWDLYLTARG